VRVLLRGRSFRIPLIWTVVLGSGCYTFRSTDVEAVRTGMELRASLTPSGTESVGAMTGERHTSVVGTLARLRTDSLVLSVWRSDLAASNFAPGRVDLPLRRDQVAGLEERRLSPARTGGLLTGVAGGLFLLVRVVWQGVGGGPGDGGGGGPVI
jgi:hypothetical protein